MPMIWMIVKWVIVPLLLIVAALALTGKKTFHIETFIPAEPEKVWAVLMDTEAYSEWNPVFVKVEGSYSKGGKVRNQVLDPKGQTMDITASVEELVEHKELRQYGGFPVFLTFDHQWLLEPVEGGTKVTQHEVDKGFYMWFWDSSWIEPSYTKVSEALRDRVISLAN